MCKCVNLLLFHAVNTEPIQVKFGMEIDYNLD